MIQATAAAQAPDTDYAHIEVRRVSGALGAEIRGVDLAAPLATEVAEEIHRAFLAHALVLFRDQDLPPDRQIAFTRLFGEVVGHPLYRSAPIEGFPEVLVIEHKAGQHFNGRNDIWHSDLTFTECPALGSVLHCRACWEGFGDTLFANQYLARETLSDGLREFLGGLRAEHSSALLVARNNAEANNVAIGEAPAPIVHPVIRTHPETGRKALYVNPAFTMRLLDVTPEESASLLEHLYRHAVAPRFTYRHRWRVGDVVMFDNRCLMHYVVLDYPAQMHRRMHRTTAGGDRPF